MTNSSSKTLGEMVHSYLLACQVEGKSPNTVRAYRETLDIFLRIAKQEGFPDDVAEIAPDHIYTYLGRIMQTGVSLATRHRRHREVRFFFSWLLRLGYLPSHPFERIKNLRLPQLIVQPFSQPDIARLLSAAFLTPTWQPAIRPSSSCCWTPASVSTSWCALTSKTWTEIAIA